MDDASSTTEPEQPTTADTPAVADAGSEPELIGLSFSWGRVKLTIDTLLTALILAFVFRAFMIEAFIIPTGSMARSLNGAHGTHVCRNCGWESDFGPAPRSSDAQAPFVWPRFIVCPNCQERTDAPEQVCPPPKLGDRVLVHKWPFDLGGWLGPKRWDVIVFRDPADSKINYIKRLAGLPGETVEIIQGDLFIRRRGDPQARIARKTPAAQESLWFVVYDQNYIAEHDGHYGIRARWVHDRGGTTATGWRNLARRTIQCRPIDDEPDVIRFAPEGPHAYLQDLYAYNRRSSGTPVADVRLVAELTPRGGNGSIEFQIKRGEFLYGGRLERNGAATLTITSLRDSQDVRVIGRAALSRLRDGRPMRLELAHLDYRVYWSIDGKEVVSTSDAQYAPDLPSLREHSGDMPAVELSIVGEGLAFDLRGLRIDRDVHYTYRPGITRRAWPGNGFLLEEDEYFVLGDNSPESHDGREWYRAGEHMPDDYRLGTVRADKIVGRAFFVYLPGLMPIDQRGRLRVIDIGRTRFVR